MPNDPFVDVGDLTSLGKLRYLDVRDQAAFDAGHAHGAIRVRLDEWDAVAKAADTGFATTAYWDKAPSAAASRSGSKLNSGAMWYVPEKYSAGTCRRGD